MKTSQSNILIQLLILLTMLGSSLNCRADSTISFLKNDAWGGNIGWTDWNWQPGAPNGGNGAVVTEYFLSGMIYGANVGWINLGAGAPANGIRYQNITLGGSVDFGVNHDGAGGLTGFAWGANIGWIVFEQSWTSPPRINLITGRFSGYAYSANCGWINLGEDAVHYLDASSILCGNDADSDGINDAWENEQTLAASGTASTAVMDALTDSDGDGVSDLDEYSSDTNPFDPDDALQIISVLRDTGSQSALIEWTASPRRIYNIQSSLLLESWDEEVKNIVTPGPIGSEETPDPSAVRRFWRVVARRPLVP